MDLEVELHHLVDIKGVDAAGDGHAHGVADEGGDVMILDEERVLREDGALVRLLDIGLDGDHAFFAGLAEDVEEHFERLGVALLGDAAAFEHTHETGDHALEHVHGVGGEDGADGRAGDREELRWLDQDGQLALFHQESADDRPKHYKNADNRKHSSPRLCRSLSFGAHRLYRQHAAIL